MFLNQQQKNTLTRELDRIDELVRLRNDDPIYGYDRIPAILTITRRIRKLLTDQPNTPTAVPE